MSMYKVQDNVPLIPVARGKPARRKWPVDTMVPGQFFFAPGKSGPSVSAYVSRITKKLAGTFAVRDCWARQNDKTEDWLPCEPTDDGATEGVGVWRTE